MNVNESCQSSVRPGRPLVSVVMIAYNNGRYISDAISGVLAQKGDFDLQLVVCDDCSTDSTPEIIGRLAAKYPGIIDFHINASNLGVQGNYLEAFRHVRGDYMAMCDADDYWTDSTKLARQVGYMESHPDCSITFHRVINYYEESGVKSFSNGGQKTDTTIADLSRSNYITNMSVVYRRHLVDLGKLPLWLNDVRLVDYPMHMLYAAQGRIHYINRPMGVYRQTASAIWSMTQMTARREMSLIVRLHLLDEFKNNSVAADGLRCASKAILTSMIADDPDNAGLKSRLAGYVRQIDPRLTSADIMADAARLAASRQKPPLISRICRWGRIKLSRLIPVPKPARRSL